MPTAPVSKRPPRDHIVARRARRRNEILDAADSVIRREGAGASLNQIVAEAGIAKPILYRHFGDKDGLYQALAERYARTLMERLRRALLEARAPRERLAATIETYLAFIEENSESYEFLMRRAERDGVAARTTLADFIQQVAGEIAVELSEELRRAQLDSAAAEPWAHGIVGMVQLAGDWWVRHRTLPREQLVEYLTTLLWDGFAGLPPIQR